MAYARAHETSSTLKVIFLVALSAVCILPLVTKNP